MEEKRYAVFVVVVAVVVRGLAIFIVGLWISYLFLKI